MRKKFLRLMRYAFLLKTHTFLGVFRRWLMFFGVIRLGKIIIVFSVKRRTQLRVKT